MRREHAPTNLRIVRRGLPPFDGVASVHWQNDMPRARTALAVGMMARDDALLPLARRRARSF
jgi:hypothetical protein